MKSEVKYIENEKETLTLGKHISRHCSAPFVIYLSGELGMGKTTLVRGLLSGLNYEGNVKSPTYTIVEPYELNNQEVYHFDLYRISDPEELEYIGIKDYFNDNSICIIEWPEKAKGTLPQANLEIEIEQYQHGRKMTLVWKD